MNREKMAKLRTEVLGRLVILVFLLLCGAAISGTLYGVGWCCSNIPDIVGEREMNKPEGWTTSPTSDFYNTRLGN